MTLVKRTDEDADHRLPLLEQATPLLYSGDCSSLNVREPLAEKFERWRFQRLNKYGDRLSADDRLLVDTLDLATNRLLQGPVRPPKAPRRAIHSEPVLDVEPCACSLGSVQIRVEEALNARIPVDTIAQAATQLTLRHFQSPASDGLRSMRLYAPLYLSNFCINHCLYCSFRFPHELDRVHLPIAEAIAQADILRERGHRHILLVAGDFPKLTSTDYFLAIIREVVSRGFSVAVEVAPQTTVAYRQMVRAGASGVTLYQETYQEELYRGFHPRGTKVWFDWRLEGPERAAEAGMLRLGLGILLGLADPTLDIRCLIRHGRYLLDRFPTIHLAFSLPRIHEVPDAFEPPHRVDDETLVRLYCALRLAFPSADLVLSTREPAELRDRLAAICVTQMSAGSCTSPGGYGSVEDETDSRARQQFPVYDHRSVEEVAATLQQGGFHLSWDA